MNLQPSEIAVINQSNGDLTDDDCALMSRFSAMQLAGDFANDWNLGPSTVKFYPGAKTSADVPATSIPHYLLQNATQAGLLGFHSVDPNGRAYINTFTGPTLQNGGSKWGGPNSVLVTMTHENNEVTLDNPCCIWVVVPDGISFPYNDPTTGQSRVIVAKNTLMAFESSDVVEAFAYPVSLSTGEAGYVTDYIKPTYWNAGTKGPYDKMGILSAPFTVATNGYCILRLEDGTTISSFSRTYPQWKLEKKQWDASRAMKRHNNFGATGKRHG